MGGYIVEGYLAMLSVPHMIVGNMGGGMGIRDM